MQQARTPGLHFEHDSPTRYSNCSFSITGELDFIEFLVDPVFVIAVVVQLVKNFQCFVGAINLDKVTWRFREKHDTEDDQETGNTLEGERKSPGE